MKNETKQNSPTTKIKTDTDCSQPIQAHDISPAALATSYTLNNGVDMLESARKRLDNIQKKITRHRDLYSWFQSCADDMKYLEQNLPKPWTHSEVEQLAKKRKFNSDEKKCLLGEAECSEALRERLEAMDRKLTLLEMNSGM
jgi:hypothetical protein